MYAGWNRAASVSTSSLHTATGREKYKVHSSPYSYTKLKCHPHVLYQQKDKSPLFLLLAYSIFLIFTRVSERNVAPFFSPAKFLMSYRSGTFG